MRLPVPHLTGEMRSFLPAILWVVHTPIQVYQWLCWTTPVLTELFLDPWEAVAKTELNVQEIFREDYMWRVMAERKEAGKSLRPWCRGLTLLKRTREWWKIGQEEPQPAALRKLWPSWLGAREPLLPIRVLHWQRWPDSHTPDVLRHWLKYSGGMWHLHEGLNSSWSCGTGGYQLILLTQVPLKGVQVIQLYGNQRPTEFSESFVVYSTSSLDKVQAPQTVYIRFRLALLSSLENF